MKKLKILKKLVYFFFKKKSFELEIDRIVLFLIAQLVKIYYFTFKKKDSISFSKQFFILQMLFPENTL
jgi:hypothetical protein